MKKLLVLALLSSSALGMEKERKTEANDRLWHALYKNDVELIQQAIDEGADLAILDEFETQLEPLTTPTTVSYNKMLNDAICRNNLEETFALVLSITVDHHGDINAQNEAGWSALHFAASYGYTTLVELLLSYGAHIDIEDHTKRTPLHLAVANRHKKTALFLVSNGATINAQDYDGWTPLHYATNYNSLELVEWLVDAKASINIIDRAGKSPFYHAIINKYDKIAKHLLYHGVDPLITENSSQHDIYYIRVYPLEQHGILAQDAKSNRPQQSLNVAIKDGYYGIIKLITQKNKLAPKKEDIELAKTLWLKTRNPIYQKIGKLLIAPQRLLQKVAQSQTGVKLPEDILNLIIHFINR
jgi:ankyrin repeat protein